MFERFLTLRTRQSLLLTVHCFDMFSKIATVVESTLTECTDVILIITVNTFNVSVQIELATKSFITNVTCVEAVH